MRLRLVKSVLFLASMALCSAAGAANLVVTNSDDLTIVIKNASTVHFDQDGNLLLECQTVSTSDNRCCVVVGDDPCAPLGSTTTPGDTTAPSIPSGLAATAVSTSQINLSWTASTDTGGSGLAGYRVERCQGTSCTNFAQVGTPAITSHSSTGLAASTTYRFRVRAVDGAGNLSGYSTTVSGTTQTTGGTESCDLSGPLIAPSSMTRIDKTWGELFGQPFGCSGSGCTQPTFPQAWGYPHPIGSNRMAYTVVPLDPTTDFNVKIGWDSAQVQPSASYGNPRPANTMLISISPCPGDLRAPDSGASDQFGKPACRKVTQGGSLYYSTISSGLNQCGLEKGKRYYLNVSPVSTGTGTPLDACPSGFTGCEVQARHDVQL